MTEIQRYRISGPDWCEREDDEGQLVYFSDYLATVEQLQHEIEKLCAIIEWLDYYQDCDLAGAGLHVRALCDGWRTNRTLRQALEYAVEHRPVPRMTDRPTSPTNEKGTQWDSISRQSIRRRESG